MSLHAIVKQIAEQLKGHVPINKKEGYSSLYPFDSSIDYYINPTIAFTDPRDDKEHMLDYKDDEDLEINPHGTGNREAEPDNHGIGHT